MEEQTLQVSNLIPLIWYRCKGCFKDFPAIKYAYVACFKTMWFVFALRCLIVFMVYWTATYSELFQTFKMEIFVKIVTSNEINFLLRRFGKGSEYTSAKCKVNCLARLCYICIYMYTHVYFAISVQLDFYSKP